MDMLDLSCIVLSRPGEQCSLIGSAVDSHTGSTYNMDLMKTWLQACQETHWLCKLEGSSKTPPPLPTRVIEIDIDGQSRITETGGIQAEYITLSYCWGEGKKLLCKKESGLYEQFKQRLPVDDSMPKTFKDALQVTRSLGYRYLWIDALCIVQDDPEDVAKEMARMGDIYRQSLLTIFAANGPNTNAGLFAQRDARSHKPCNIQMTMKQGSNRLNLPVSIKPPSQDRRSALQTRGWVLQEEVLSGSSLAFGPHTVNWSCVTSRAAEDTPCMYALDSKSHWKDAGENKSRRHDVEAMRLMIRRPDIFSKLTPSTFGRQRKHFDIWYDLVANYSHRSLSVSSDKLLAVGGLASLMQKNYNLTYAAGLWKEDLLVGLCWWPYPRHSVSGRKEPESIDGDLPGYLAPTWSWVSAHDTAVGFEEPDGFEIPEEGIQVINLEVSYRPGPLAAFGHIECARLSIFTRMRRMVLQHQPNPHLRWPGHSYKAGPFLCVNALDPLTNSCIGVVSLDSMRLYKDVPGLQEDHQMDSSSYSASEYASNEAVCDHILPFDEYEAWCVPCSVQTWSSDSRVMKLLVLTSIDADKQEYRRIGKMTLYGESSNIFTDEREIIHIL